MHIDSLRKSRVTLFLLALVAVIVAATITGRTAQQPAPATLGAAQGAAPGQASYENHCAECHGMSGKGDGPAASQLNPRPRDLTSGKFKIRSTESGTPPTDEDLLRTVQEGLSGTSMPAWKGVLSEDDIRQVTSYVKTFSPRFASEQPQPIAAAHRDPSPGRVAAGRQVYEKLQCGKCHGDDGRGTGAIAVNLEDDWKQPVRASDLTEPWTFRGGSAVDDIYMRFRAGMSGTPMPSFKEAATDQDMWDLADYVVSMARKPFSQLTAQEVADFYAAEDARAKAHPVERGKYLVDTLGCPVCHSPFDDSKRMIPGMAMAGGLRIRVEPFGEYPTGNLTSDKETGIASWTDAEIKQVLTRGTLRDGTRLLPYPMDWGSFSTMSDSDLNAIVAYLRTIPPVRNKVPRPSRTFLPFYLWGKFQMLFLGGDPPMVFYPGNAGVS